MKLSNNNKDNSNKNNSKKLSGHDKRTGNKANYNENNNTGDASAKFTLLKVYLAWAGVFLWMALIFYLSHQPATESSQLSSGVLSMLMGFVQRISPQLARELEVLQLTYLIRKNAHFFAYLLLAMLTMNALAQNQVRGKRLFLYAFLICLVYAITDEVHQLFIPGRSGEVKDVLLDSFGAVTGILLYHLPAVFRHLKSSFNI